MSNLGEIEYFGGSDIAKKLKEKNKGKKIMYSRQPVHRKQMANQLWETRHLMMRHLISLDILGPTNNLIHL